ncbi:MAG: hypothetical protein R3C58_00400 [Parvularculaceae bacterium]
MSDRIRVGDILNEAFQFGLHRWPSVLRFVWLPMLAALCLSYGFLTLAIDLDAYQEAIKAANGGLVSAAPYLRMPLTAAVMLGIGVVVAMLFIYSGAYASIYRLAALGEDRPGILPFRFDGPAQRVFVGQLILAAIQLAIWGAAFIIAFASSGVSFSDIGAAFGEYAAMIGRASAEPGYKPSPSELSAIRPLGAIAVGFLFALPALLYVNVKLSPFLAGSAAENRLLLFGAFRMTRGHAWSIFGTFLLFVAAMFVLMIVLSLAMGFLGLLGSLSGAGAIGAIGQFFKALSFALDYAVQIFLTGVVLSMQAIIYRRLKTGE